MAGDKLEHRPVSHASDKSDGGGTTNLALTIQLEILLGMHGPQIGLAGLDRQPLGDVQENLLGAQHAVGVQSRVPDASSARWPKPDSQRLQHDEAGDLPVLAGDDRKLILVRFKNKRYL